MIALLYIPAYLISGFLIGLSFIFLIKRFAYDQWEKHAAGFIMWSSVIFNVAAPIVLTLIVALVFLYFYVVDDYKPKHKQPVKTKPSYEELEAEIKKLKQQVAEAVLLKQ